MQKSGLMKKLPRTLVKLKTQSLPDIFTNEIDVYNTRYVSKTSVSQNLENFTETLEKTITHFNTEKAKGFFITISLKEHSHLFPLLSEKKFTFHHAEGDDATLVTWLPKNKKNRLPGYSSHYVGVGGLVIDFKNESVLVIKEKNGHDTKGWKIPGGLVDVGEYLPEAVVREVFEETGIESKFKGIVALREKSPYYFGRNDFYFVCLLEPGNEEISQCEHEIEKSAWMPVDEFCEFEHRVGTQQTVALIAKKLIEKKRKGNDVAELYWGLDLVKTNLPTIVAEQPIYHFKL